MAIEYALTRPFPWKWFGPLVFTISLVVIAFLVTLNVALTGYETVTVFHGDFNVTQSHWYDQYLPGRVQKPGALCDSHLFNVGDQFTTNYTLFEWTIASVNNPNAGKSGVSYNGTTLEDCDVRSLYINGDLRSWTVDITAMVSCNVIGKFEVNAKTLFSVTSLPGKYSPLLGVTRMVPGRQQGDSRAVVVDQLAQIAAQDIGLRMSSVLGSTSGGPVALSVQADFNPCPASFGPTAPCAVQKPEFNITFAASIHANTSLTQHTSLEPTHSVFNPEVLDDNTLGPVSNLIQMVYAAVRIDLGNPSPNNFILHYSSPGLVNNTLVTSFPETPQASGTLALLPMGLATPRIIHIEEELSRVDVTGPAEIQVVYLCRFQRMKSTGQVFISVLVATLSMFSSGYAAFMFGATYLAKRDRRANVCDGAHSAAQSSPYMKSHDSQHGDQVQVKA